MGNFINNSSLPNKVRIAVLISGRGSNMKSIVKACSDKNFPAEVCLILSNKKDAAGLEFSQKHNIPTAIIQHHKFKNATDPRKAFDEAMDNEISKYNIDLICLAGFMRILSPWFVKKWHQRLINIHPSLLPNFKGANAVADALKAGAKESGCTVHYVEPEIDSGPTILQSRVEINENDDLISLKDKILKYEHEIYPQAIAIVCQKLLEENKR